MDTALLWRAWGVLALVLVLTATLTRAESNRVTLTTIGVLTFDRGAFGQAPSRSNAERLCADKGGILPADYSSKVGSDFAAEMISASGGVICTATASGWTMNCYGMYTAGTAQHGSCQTNIRPSFDINNWNTGCNFRWTLGWFGRLSTNGVVGTEFWESTWAHLRHTTLSDINSEAAMRQYALTADYTGTDANIYASGSMNGYTDSRWNASYQCSGGPQCIAPRGNVYIALGARLVKSPQPLYFGMRVDVPDVAAADSTPFAIPNYVLGCQWQGVEDSYYTSTQLPSQYPFVQGWKTLTWAQSHWWVIFLIVAVVILIILFIILIYCCCTRKPLPEGDRVIAMSMREREGSLYVVMDEEVDEEVDESKGTVRTTSTLTNPRFVRGDDGASGSNPLLVHS